MLQATGLASSTCFRRAPRGIPQRLIIPHHGIHFQRGRQDGPRRRRTENPSQQRSRVRTGLSQDAVEQPVQEAFQSSELKKKSKAQNLEGKYKTPTSREDSAWYQQIISNMSMYLSTGKNPVAEVELPVRRIEPEQSKKRAQLGLDAVRKQPQSPEEKRHLHRNPVDLDSLYNPNFPRPNEPHFYHDTIPPSDDELLAAGRFFRQVNPKFAFSCARFLEFPDSNIPEFCFIGRSNVGKSSLLNALFYAHSWGMQEKKGLAVTGSRAGKTKLMNVFLAGNFDGGTKTVYQKGKPKAERWIGTGRGIAVVDMPGYGFGSKDSQGEEIMKYLSNRKQLRRTFVLVNAEHGATNYDKQMFQILEQAGVSYQIVLTKVDQRLNAKFHVHPSINELKRGFKLLRQTKANLDQIVKPPLRDVLCVSAAKSLNTDGRFKHEFIGMNGLRLAMLQAAGLDQLEVPVVPMIDTRRRNKPIRPMGPYLVEKELKNAIA